MNTKQKKTLLGAIVALILVGTIIVVVLAVKGTFSKTDPVEEVLKAVKEALEAKEGIDPLYKGGVYIKVQEQYLGEDKKPIDTKEEDLLEDEENRKKIKIALQKVTVYGVKSSANGKLDSDAVESEKVKDLFQAMDDAENKNAVVINKEVEFTDVAVGYGENYPVLQKVMDAYQVAGANGKFCHKDGKFGMSNGNERVYFKRVELTTMQKFKELIQKFKDVKNVGKFKHFYFGERVELKFFGGLMRDGEDPKEIMLKEVTLFGSTVDLGETNLQQLTGDMVPFAKALIKSPKFRPWGDVEASFHSAMEEADVRQDWGNSVRTRVGHGEDWMEYSLAKLK